MREVSDGELVPGLLREVVERVRSELGPRANKVLGCLRTAFALAKLAKEDTTELRLAASAAYNVREALNNVVAGRDPAEGGLRAVRDAWQRYDAQIIVPDADPAAARQELDMVIRRAVSDESRALYHVRQLLAYLEERTGVAPRSDGARAPISEYSALRDIANSAVHDEISPPDLDSLLTRTLAWFVRMFTPPEQVVHAIRALAAQPWRGPDQITELEEIVTNDHHLRLFLGAIIDPAWLEPLCEAGFVRMPQTGVSWPGAALLGGLGTSAPASVGTLLERVLADTVVLDTDEQLAARWELLRVAVLLGPAGHRVVARIVKLHANVHEISSFAVGAARKADPADPVVLTVADCVLNHFDEFNDFQRHNATEILNHLSAGVTADNIAERAKALAGKTRRRARHNDALYTPLGVEPLADPPGDHPAPLLLFAHHLARMLTKARQLGVPTSTQLTWLGNMVGQVGERLRGHVLTGADDVSVAEKIAHISARLISTTATAEDQALVNDILSHELPPDDLAVWSEVLGTPSPALEDVEVPADWARAWRWAAVLPASLMESWQDAIAAVNARYGALEPKSFTAKRKPRSHAGVATSPYTVDELSDGAANRNAQLVSVWEPCAEEDWRMVGRLELARTLADTVKADPAKWSADPQQIVSTLGRALYIEHYFRGLKEQAADVVWQGSAIVTAALEWLSTEDGRDQDDRGQPIEVVLDLVRALADKDADLTTNLDELWDTALAAVRKAPVNGDGLLFGPDQALTSAINRTWGHGLQTVFALAAWEFRNLDAVRPELDSVLGSALAARGSTGLEFRALIAAYRVLLERIATSWLEAHSTELFREGWMARETFDLTVAWAHPTTWLYRHFRPELFAAALRQADNAVRLVVIATLRGTEGYDDETVIKRLGTKPEVLSAAAEDVAFLVQDADADELHLAVATRFWERLLDTDRTVVPPAALAGLGRWAFVEAVDDTTWADLTARTLDISDGHTTNQISVADRAKRIHPSTTTHKIFLRLVDRGEPWKRSHTAANAIGSLRAATDRDDPHYLRLQTRLIDLGYHEASFIAPPATPD